MGGNLREGFCHGGHSAHFKAVHSQDRRKGEAKIAFVIYEQNSINWH
jgi:hypothetical protein